MSTSLTPPSSDAPTGTTSRGVGVPGPRSTSTPRSTGTTSGTGTGTTGTTGTTGIRFFIVVLVSVVLSVAASTSVVALTGTGADAVQPGPAPVVQQDRGQDGAEQEAVEDGAAKEIGELDVRRADAFCPTPSHPPVAC